MNINILAIEETKRALSNKRNLAVIFGFIIFASLVPAVILSATLKEIPKNIPISKDELIISFIKLYFFTYSISLALFIIHAISMDIFVSDKKERALEVLLTYPISVRTLWLAKSLALFTISYPSAVITSGLFIISANILIAKGWRYFPDVLMLVYAVTLLPILIFLVIALAGVWQLIARRFSAVNFILFLIAFIVMGVPSFLVSRLSVIHTTTFVGIYLIISIVLALIIFFVERLFLTKERVVLSY